MPAKPERTENLTTAALPEGKARVRETTTRIYEEPHAADPAAPSPLPECNYCGDPIKAEELRTDDADYGLCHNACLKQAQAEDAEQAQQPQSAWQQLLASCEMEKVAGEGEGAKVIYIRRRSDLPNSKYRKPYIGPLKTISDMPFDESLTSRAAIELGAARMHGGGYYQFEIRQGGQYVHSWSMPVDDPPLEEEKKEPASAAPAVEIVSSRFAGLKELAQEFKTMRQIMADLSGDVKTAHTAAEAETAVASNGDRPRTLLGQITEVVNSYDAAKRMFLPEGADLASGKPEAGETHTWVNDVVALGDVTGISNLLKKVGDVIAQPVGQIGLQVGLKLYERMTNPQEKAVREEADKAAGQQPAPRQELPAGEKAAEQDLGKTGQPAHTPAGNAPTPGKHAVPDQALQLLEPIVKDLISDNPVDGSIALCTQALQFAGKDVREFLDPLLKLSPLKLALWLSTIEHTPDWSMIADLDHAPAFCKVFKDEMLEVLAAYDEEAALLAAEAESEPPREIERNNLSHGVEAGGHDVSRGTPREIEPKNLSHGVNVAAPTAKGKDEGTKGKGQRAKG